MSDQGKISFSCSALQRLKAKTARDNQRSGRRSKQAAQCTARPTTARREGLRYQRWNGIPELMPHEAILSRPSSSNSKVARPPTNPKDPVSVDCLKQLRVVEAQLRAARVKDPGIAVLKALTKLSSTNPEAARALELLQSGSANAERYPDIGAELVDEIAQISCNRMYYDAPRPPPTVPLLSPSYKTSNSTYGRRPDGDTSREKPSNGRTYNSRYGSTKSAGTTRCFRKKSRPVATDVNGQAGSWPFETNWPADHRPKPPPRGPNCFVLRSGKLTVDTKAARPLSERSRESKGHRPGSKSERRSQTVLRGTKDAVNVHTSLGPPCSTATMGQLTFGG